MNCVLFYLWLIAFNQINGLPSFTSDPLLNFSPWELSDNSSPPSVDTLQPESAVADHIQYPTLRKGINNNCDSETDTRGLCADGNSASTFLAQVPPSERSPQVSTPSPSSPKNSESKPKKCEYYDNRSGVIFHGICNENDKDQCDDVSNPYGTTEIRLGIDVGTFCDLAVDGKIGASRRCCAKQMKCSPPYSNYLCMSDDDAAIQQCRKTGGWLEVAIIPHCPHGLRCCLRQREEYDPEWQKDGPIFHHDDGSYTQPG